LVRIDRCLCPAFANESENHCGSLWIGLWFAVGEGFDGETTSKKEIDIKNMQKKSNRIKNDGLFFLSNLDSNNQKERVSELPRAFTPDLAIGAFGGVDTM